MESRPKRSDLSYLFFLITSILYVLPACDNSFDPLKENDRFNFTIYATLDLSADTQWVRVMPVRDSIFTTPKPIDATVTLTRESTGETEILKDSLFLLPQGYYAWNFWTDTPLLPEEEYTIRAEAPDGRFSQGTGVIPKNFPNPEISFDERDQSFRITIDAMVERLVVAQINYAFIITYDNGHPPTYNPYYPVNYIKDVIHKPNGSYQFTANIVPNIALQYSVDTNQVYLIGDKLIIVSADSNWPDSTGIASDRSISLNVSSNVENGLGVVTGIVSKNIPILEWR